MKTIPGSRRYQRMARVGIFLIVAALLAVLAGSGCNGFRPPTPPGPSLDLEIRTWYDLDAIRDNLSGHHRLMNDLDATTAGYEELAGPTANGGKGWKPIGSTLVVRFEGDERIVGVHRFAGTLDGQGYEIRDLFINRLDENYVGLFRHLGEGGVIENLGVVDVTVSGNEKVGGLVGGNAAGTVNSCHAEGSVVGEATVGGLVGVNSNTVVNSCFTGNVTGVESVGGLVGRTWSTVSNSYYDYDEVLVNGEHIITVGALSGADFGEWLTNDRFLDVNDRLRQDNGYYVINDIDDFRQLLAFGQDDLLKFRLHADLDLAAEPGLYIPYLAGEFDGNGHRISNLTFDFDFVSNVGLFGYLRYDGRVTRLGVENASITGSGSVGGLVGLNQGTVSDSYSIGIVTGHKFVGGMVGLNRGTASSSYSGGTVTGHEHVGGLVGSNDGTVSNSYATGGVTGGLNTGGLVGKNDWGSVTNAFWDVEASGMEASDGGTGKTTAQMKNVATFTDTETEGLDEPWDIIAVGPGERDEASIWNIVDGETYPFLSWEST